MCITKGYAMTKVRLNTLIYAFLLLIAATSFPVSANVNLTRTNSDCRTDCPQTLTVGKLKFSYSHEASLLEAATYNDIEWALVSVTHTFGDRTVTDYYMHNSQSRKRSSYEYVCWGLDRDISKNGQILCISANKISVIGGFQGQKNHSWNIQPSAKSAVIDHNPNGTLSFAYISEQKEGLEYWLYVNDFDGVMSGADWHTHITKLHSRSDFRNILAVDSVGDGTFVVALYEWINSFNKGLTGYYFPADGDVAVGHVKSSESFNFGFSPKVKVTSNTTHFSATNSSSRQRELVSMSKEELQDLKYNSSSFLKASNIDVMIGGGIQPSTWKVDQKVEVDDDVKAETKYKMNSNLLKSYFIQGRWGKSQLALTMLKNEAEEVTDKESNNDFEKAGINQYVVQYDYHGLFKGANTLRLEYRGLNAGGSAEYNDNGQIERSYFDSERSTYRALVMGERGVYWGAYYSKYDSPSVVGLVNYYGSLDGVAFDKDFSLTKLGAVIGYDEAAYGNRYETDYNRWYWGGEMGIGTVHFHTNNDTLYKAIGENSGGIHGKNGIEFRAELDTGYIWQRKIKSLRGLGASLQLGYKVQYEYIDQDPTDDEERPEDGWSISYTRSDLIHGPYLKLNLLF